MKKEKQNKKGGILKWIIIIVVILGVIGWMAGGNNNNEATLSNVSESSKTAQVEETPESSDINNFSYNVQEDKVLLEEYEGEASTLVIEDEYVIEGTSYQTDLSSFQVSANSVKTLLIKEGITELKNSIFNGSNVETLYLPKSLTYIYDDTLAYLNSDHIDLYYGGTEEEWMSILIEYNSSSVVDEVESGNAEEAGTALADKLNSYLGHEFDESKFSINYGINIDDLM